MNQQRNTWYVVTRPDEEAEVVDHLNSMDTVIHSGPTIRECNDWMDMHDINRIVPEPTPEQLAALEKESAELDREIHQESIRQLKEQGFDEAQIQRVIEHNWLLYTA